MAAPAAISADVFGDEAAIYFAIDKFQIVFEFKSQNRAGDDQPFLGHLQMHCM